MSAQTSIANILRLVCATGLLATAMLLAPTAPARAGGPWYVDGWGGSDANACNAPNLPCKTINAAIARAQPGDSITVTGGVYTNPGGSEVVRVDKDLALLGGWGGGYTIINGEQVRRGLVVAPGVTVQMDNFIIVYGWDLDGGGAYVEGALNGTHLIVGLNRAWFGGGVYLAPGGRLNLANTAIYGNEYFADGGGIFIDGGTSYIANVTISSNFSVTSIDEEHCHQYTYGGGVLVQNDGCPAIDSANAYYCPPFDQRRVPRPQGLVCDIGAFERLGSDPEMDRADLLPCPLDDTSQPVPDDCLVGGPERLWSLLGPRSIAPGGSSSLAAQDNLDGLYPAPEESP